MNEVTGTVFNILRYCIHDGPGIRTTVFLKGCPLSCWWCQNPEGLKLEREVLYNSEKCLQCGDCLETCPHDAIINREGLFTILENKCLLTGDCVDVCSNEARRMIGKHMMVSDIVNEVEKDLVFYEESGGGVTFSGGEPLNQPGFLQALLRSCKEKGLHTAVDTSGYALPEVFNQIKPYTDLFLFDLKTLDEKAHKRHTGVSNELIIENIKTVNSQQNRLIVRIPIIPRFNDNLKSILEIGEFVQFYLKVNEIHLLPFHNIGIEKYTRFSLESSLQNVGSVSQKKLNDFSTELTKLGLQVKIGG